MFRVPSLWFLPVKPITAQIRDSWVETCSRDRFGALSTSKETCAGHRAKCTIIFRCENPDSTRVSIYAKIVASLAVGQIDC